MSLTFEVSAADRWSDALADELLLERYATVNAASLDADNEYATRSALLLSAMAAQSSQPATQEDRSSSASSSFPDSSSSTPEPPRKKRVRRAEPPPYSARQIARRRILALGQPGVTDLDVVSPLDVPG